MSNLAANHSGMAMVEFALVLPVMLTLGLVGIETANFAIAHQRVSQIAMMTADNASRVRTQMSESYINQLFTGVEKSGSALAFKQHGKVILSSVQNNENADGQWIRWQRCFGMKAGLSKYGIEGKGENDRSLQALNGLTAQAGTAVMFVEVSYDYQPIVPNSPLAGNTISYETAAVVRQRTDFGISGTNTAQCTS